MCVCLCSPSSSQFPLSQPGPHCCWTWRPQSRAARTSLPTAWWARRGRWCRCSAFWPRADARPSSPRKSYWVLAGWRCFWWWLMVLVGWYCYFQKHVVGDQVGDIMFWKWVDDNDDDLKTNQVTLRDFHMLGDVCLSQPAGIWESLHCFAQQPCWCQIRVKTPLRE